MIISPKTAIDEGWITGVINADTQLSSDGIDLTLHSIYSIDTTKVSVLTESKAHTQHRPVQLITPISANNYIPPIGVAPLPLQELYCLTTGVYDIAFNECVKLPKGVAARLLLRSSFVRAGHTLHSGLYDQGFENRAGAILHINGRTILEPNIRVAQIIFVRSEGTGSLYAGGYNFKEGDVHWQDAAARSAERAAQQ